MHFSGCEEKQFEDGTFSMLVGHAQHVARSTAESKAACWLELASFGPSVKCLNMQIGTEEMHPHSTVKPIAMDVSVGVVCKRHRASMQQRKVMWSVLLV